MWEMREGIIGYEGRDCVELASSIVNRIVGTGVKTNERNILMQTRLKRVLVLSSFVLILSACRVVVDTRVNSDGSGELRNSIVFSAQEKQDFTASSDNAGKSICDSLGKDTPPDGTFLEEESGGETYCTTVNVFSNLRGLQDHYGTMGNVTVNELRLSFGKFVFDAQVDLTPKGENEPAPVEWRLTVPGEVADTNADIVNDRTLVWNIEPGQVRTLHAESAVGLDMLTLLFIGAAILMLGIMVGIYLIRNRPVA